MYFELGFSIIIVCAYGFGLLALYGIVWLFETIKFNIDRAIYMRKWRKLTRPYSK